MDSYNELKLNISKCQNCDLCKERKNPVIGQGVIDADIMFIGEGPGQTEDEQGLPFVGKSGQLLDKFLFADDLSRNKNIYIANMVKCRPPENRNPNDEEMAACKPFLLRQIELINPKIIVCLGRISAQSMINPNFKVTTEHGKFFEINGRHYMGTFHPAALLRNPSQKPLALEDFQKLREKIIALNISLR